MQKQPPV
jgi:hypothetical protein